LCPPHQNTSPGQCANPFLPGPFDRPDSTVNAT
jgi:hypothetical protein